MNHREPPHLTVGARRALRCLSLLLIPALVPKSLPALARPPRSAPGRPADLIGDVELVPYLPAIGALPLRFQQAPPPPDLTTRPAAAAPPVPSLSVSETTVAQANAAAAHSAPMPSRVASEVLVAEAKPEPKATPPAPQKAAPAPIIPDDTRPTVRAEDFLPYFQIPGSAKQPGEMNVIVPAPRGAPAPAPLPPSAATYNQTK